METLKILIVDDEKYEGILIEKCLDWAAHGFEIIGNLQDADAAMDCFHQLRPDIVLCDINMPVIDGLELSRQMKLCNPDVHIVIVTGYQEFEYAKDAIRIGVDNYILKPIQAEELLETAEMIRGKVMAETDRKMPSAGADPAQVKNDLIRAAVSYIEDNLSARGLSLGSIAPAIYSNRSYLSRVFREETGETVTSYILRRRIEKSRELFDTTDLRVYEVASLIGIPDAHYFGQCFKRATGLTVNEYRSKKQRMNGDEGAPET